MPKEESNCRKAFYPHSATKRSYCNSRQSPMKLDRYPASPLTMYRRHQGSGYTIMVSKPPKPPSWRDFEPVPEPINSRGPSSTQVSKSPPSKSSMNRRSRELEFVDVLSSKSKQKSHSEGSDLSRLGIGHHHSSSHVPLTLPVGHSHTLPNPHKSHKKGKGHQSAGGRLHRTRSQYNLEQSELPRADQLTMSLAETKPREFGLRKSDVFDPMIYLNDNAKRCAKWLRQVNASQPLEDVGLSKLIADDHHQARDDVVEDLEHDLKHDQSSTCGSDLDSVSVCAAHRSDLTDKQRLEHIRLPVHESPAITPRTKLLSRSTSRLDLHQVHELHRNRDSVEVLHTNFEEDEHGSSQIHRGNGGGEHGSQVSNGNDSIVVQCLTPFSNDGSNGGGRCSPSSNRSSPKAKCTNGSPPNSSSKHARRKISTGSKENKEPEVVVPQQSHSNKGRERRSEKSRKQQCQKVIEMGTTSQKHSLDQFIPGYVPREDEFKNGVNVKVNR